MKYVSYIGFFISLFIIIGAIILQHQLAQLQALGLFGIFLLNIIGSVTLFIPIPGFISVIAGGSIYPPVLVAIVASLGSVIGDSISFLLGYSGGKITQIEEKQHKIIVVLLRSFKKYGGILLFCFSFFPNPLFDSIGIVAGIFHYPFLKFFLIAFIGRLLRYIIFAYLGQLGSL